MRITYELELLPPVSKLKMTNQTIEITHPTENYLLSTAKERISFDVLFKYLSEEAYWSKGKITEQQLQGAINNSINFGIYQHDRLVGYCRVVTDQATMAYLADVFILLEHRGKGLSKWLLENVMQHPDLQNLRRWILLTDDAHGLYRQFGWTELTDPGLYMERTR